MIRVEGKCRVWGRDRNYRREGEHEEFSECGDWKCREMLNQSFTPMKTNRGHVPNPDTQRRKWVRVADGAGGSSWVWPPTHDVRRGWGSGHSPCRTELDPAGVRNVLEPVTLCTRINCPGGEKETGGGLVSATEMCNYTRQGFEKYL